MLWAYFKMLSSVLSPCQKGGFFLSVHYETLVGFLEVKPMQAWYPLWLQPLGVSHSHAILYCASSNLSKLLFQCPYQFRALAASASGKLISVVMFCVHQPLLISGGGFTCDLNPLMAPRKVVDFHFVQLFSCKDTNGGF